MTPARSSTTVHDTPHTLYRSVAGAQKVAARYRQLLDTWPVAREERYVQTSQGTTFVVISGPPDAPPVVLLQGSGANTAMWLPTIADLASSFRIYAVDTIGEAGFSAPSRPTLTSDAHARWLHDVIQDLRLTRPSLVGVSLGGRLALDYALEFPGELHRLMLLNPSGIGDRRLKVLLQAALLMQLGSWGQRQTLRLALRGTPVDTENHSTLEEYTLLIFKYFKPRLEPIPLFSDAQLRALTCPTRVVVGQQDAMINADQTFTRISRLGGPYEAQLLPHAGHLISDQADRIREFLTAPRPETAQHKLLGSPGGVDADPSL